MSSIATDLEETVQNTEINELRITARIYLANYFNEHNDRPRIQEETAEELGITPGSAKTYISLLINGELYPENDKKYLEFLRTILEKMQTPKDHYIYALVPETKKKIQRPDGRRAHVIPGGPVLFDYDLTQF
jgi:hypothetical protein